MKKKTTQLTLDGFFNSMTNTGLSRLNPIAYTGYQYQNITMNYQMLVNLYKSNWVVKRIVNVVAGDMLRSGYKILSQIDPSAFDRIKKLEQKFKVNQKLKSGIQWARLFGGAGGLIVIEGDENLEEPLNYDLVMPKSFKGILIFDCRQGITPSPELIEDITNPEFGLPKYYNLSNDALNSVKVHHSRILRFEGRELPYIDRASNNYWGASELEHVIEEITKRDNVSWNIAQLTFLANIRVLKLFGLESLQGRSNKQGISNLQRRIENTNNIMTDKGLLVLGENDDFQSFQYSFAGLGECYDRFMMDISGATEIPVTKLFGRSPAGMNATGESDMDNYYNMIAELQENMLRPIYDKLLPIMFLSEFGAIPDDLDFEFNSLEKTNELEKSDLNSRNTDSIIKAYDSGLVSQQIALKELRQQSEQTGFWTNITDEDINSANAEMQQQQFEETPEEGINNLLKGAEENGRNE